MTGEREMRNPDERLESSHDQWRERAKHWFAAQLHPQQKTTLTGARRCTRRQSFSTRGDRGGSGGSDPLGRRDKVGYEIVLIPKTVP